MSEGDQFVAYLAATGVKLLAGVMGITVGIELAVLWLRHGVMKAVGRI